MARRYLYCGRYWTAGETLRLDSQHLLRFRPRPSRLFFSHDPDPAFRADSAEVVKAEDPAWQGYYDRLRNLDRYKAIRGIARIDSEAARRLSGLPTLDLMEEYAALLAGIAESALEPTSIRTDSAAPLKRVVKWNGLEIGITNEDGEERFAGGRPLSGCCYGHLRRSYPRAADKKAVDVYWGGDAESPLAYRVYQKDPHTGVIDEHKLMLGFGSIDDARAAYTRHAGLGRFGGIEEIDIETVSGYRSDACGCKTLDEAMASGSAILPPSSLDVLEGFAQVPPDQQRQTLHSLLQSNYPTEILAVTRWQVFEKDYTGEFTTPVGVYGWRLDPKKGRLAYRWRRELASPRTDSADDRLKVLDTLDGDLALGSWLSQRARKAVAPWTKEVETFIKECGSLEVAKDRLPELFSRLPSRDLFRAYDQAFSLAYRLGQSQAELPDE